TITLVVKISATVGSIVENTTVQKSIVVVTPVVLSATFTDQGTTAAVNVTVRFYVDGALVGTETIARINPSGSATATFNYLPANLQSGTHQVRIEADLDRNGVIDPARGEVVVSSLFYRGVAPLSTGWTVLIGIAVFVPVLIVTIGSAGANRPDHAGSSNHTSEWFRINIPSRVRLIPARFRRDSSFGPSGTWTFPSTHAEATGSYRIPSLPTLTRAAAASRKVCRTT